MMHAPFHLSSSLHWPDITACNEEFKFLSSPFLSIPCHHITQKPEQLQIIAELDRLGFLWQCEIEYLGHFCKESIKAIMNNVPTAKEF